MSTNEPNSNPAPIHTVADLKAAFLAGDDGAEYLAEVGNLEVKSDWIDTQRTVFLDLYTTKVAAHRSLASAMYLNDREEWDAAEMPAVARWAVAEQLLEDAAEAARENPDLSRHFALDAVALFDDEDLPDYPAVLPVPLHLKRAAPYSREVLGHQCFLHAYALASLANAHRLQANLYEARTARAQAEKALRKGRAQIKLAHGMWRQYGASRLHDDIFGYATRARLLLVSVCRACRDLGGATAHLAASRAAITEISDHKPPRYPTQFALQAWKLGARVGVELAPRLFLLDASIRVVCGDLEGAMRANKDAADLLRGTRGSDPFLLAVALVNAADIVTRLEAEKGIDAADPVEMPESFEEHIREHGGAINILRLEAIQARRLRDADAMLRACGGFISAGASFDAALILLEVGALYIQTGKPERCVPLVATAGSIFMVNGIAAETVAALSMFSGMVQSHALTVGAVRAVAEQLRVGSVSG